MNIATTYIHCNKALKWPNALRSLRKAGLNCDDLGLVYCSLVRPVIEYASPIWVALSPYLEDPLESIQRKGLRIIFGKTEYADAMAMASLDTLKGRRVAACQRFIVNMRQLPPYLRLCPPSTYSECEYSLCSRNLRRIICWTNLMILLSIHPSIYPSIRPSFYLSILPSVQLTRSGEQGQEPGNHSRCPTKQKLIIHA